MVSSLAPGIYRAPQITGKSDIRLVRTDIAGFVGYAERGPIAPTISRQLPDPNQLAVRLTSWDEYRANFGGFTHYALMPYAVRAFFENGGTTCWVVRVGASTNTNPINQPQTAAIVLSTGDDVQQLTTLSQPAQSTSTALKVASTTGIIIRSLIGVGPLGSMEICRVLSVVDAQNLTLAAAPIANHPAGDPIWALDATSISGNAIAGQTDIQVAGTSGFNPGDIVTIKTSNLSEPSTIAGVLNNTTIRLAQKLQGTYPTGAILQRQNQGMRIEARSPGNWGNRLQVQIALLPTNGGPPNFDLVAQLAQGPDPEQPATIERYLNLSQKPGTKQKPSDIEKLNNQSSLIRICTPIAGMISGTWTLTGGRDGLSSVTVQDFTGGESDFRGLRVLEEIPEVAIIAVPDVMYAAPQSPPNQPAIAPDPCNPQTTSALVVPVRNDPTEAPSDLNATSSGAIAVYDTMLDQCQRLRYRVGILDTPDLLEPKMLSAWVQTLGLPSLVKPFAALYYPWLIAPNGVTSSQPTVRVPPSGYVAGAYAQIDNSVGVQHPPANVELQFTSEVGRMITNDQQAALNDQGVNVIRFFPGRGIRIWGARSLAAGDPNDALSQWRYIHVRRVMSMVEDSVEKSMQWTTFQSNDSNLRRMLTHSLNVFFQHLWQTGGFLGTSVDQAFYVKCDDTNNPQSGIDAGQLVCEIGVAVAAPMEFLTFQVIRTPDATDVVEA